MRNEIVDTPGQISMTYFTFYHGAHSRDLCRDFWRDPHATVAARGQGAHLYRQHHFDPRRTDVWPRINGVAHEVPQGWVPDGCDELVMDDPALIDSQDAAMFMGDERNFLGRGLFYESARGQYIWHRVDDTPMTPDCELPGERLYVFLRRRYGVSHAEFGGFVQNRLISAILESGKIREAKSYLFAPFDEYAWPSPGVAHDHPAELHYHGALLLGGDNALAIAQMFQSEAFRSTLRTQSEIFEAAYSIGVEASYPMYENGGPTLAGLRGYTCARIISRIGAVNHTKDPVLSGVVTVPGHY